MFLALCIASRRTVSCLDVSCGWVSFLGGGPEQVMGAKHMTKFDKAFGLQKRRALRDFQRNTGMELPLDKQL